MTKHKKVKAWGLTFEGRLLQTTYPTRRRARWTKTELDRLNETSLLTSVVRLEIRILPNRKAR